MKSLISADDSFNQTFPFLCWGSNLFEYSYLQNFMANNFQMESLLDAMRFREELDIRQRQRYRLQKAKNKVSNKLYVNSGFYGTLNL
jgi:hypothetical protein